MSVNEGVGMVLLGDMLFSPSYLPAAKHVFMREDWTLCTRVRHHKQKILFFLSAMRSYASELRRHGYEVHYEHLQQEDKRSFQEQVNQWRHRANLRTLVTFEPNDSFLGGMFDSLNIRTMESPSFLTGRDEWDRYKSEHPHRYHMADFYRLQRRRLGILLDENDKPLGGSWSFDKENRKPLPRSKLVPALPLQSPDPKLATLVNDWFPSHVGNAEELWLPTERSAALEWLDDFIRNRLHEFGPYEDAISSHEDVLFHSALSPLLNCGLLTPKEVLDRVLVEREVPLASLEGFVRQMIGWREFIKGMDREYGESQQPKNPLGHYRRLTAAWWEGKTGLLPLDTVICRATRLGYCHHIERLMVLGSAMLLCDVDPNEAYRWFMEMFVDSSDWVMGPNVYGMSQYADGGFFATKPYVSGSAYLKRMSNFPGGDWCDIWDALYWRFVFKNRDLLSKNQRMRPILGNLDRDKEKIAQQIRTAERFIESVTVES
ncbi:MAG TPA: cryptochrome/photolyase family protein [Fimbriimonadaceae bacterium]|nr:cryptochrome/photolyase family protein [Fimbriimonadaceae bacterium]